jgi:hypothetical protein
MRGILLNHLHSKSVVPKFFPLVPQLKHKKYFAHHTPFYTNYHRWILGGGGVR